MNVAAKKALGVIRQCLRNGAYRVLPHFIERMDRRGLFWSDVEAIAEKPLDVRDDGLDRYDRPKWLIAGRAYDGDRLTIVCAIDTDEAGNLVLSITAYWD